MKKDLKNILVIAAHPDDEVLGCGGTMAKYVKQGHQVDILIVGDGITARYEEKDLDLPEVQEQVARVNKNAQEAGRILGVRSVTVLGFHCCRFDTVALLSITKAIEEKIREVQPEIVYTQSCVDVNNDHALVFKATLAATRPMLGCCVKQVLAYEVLSSTEWNFYEPFRPNVYEEISEGVEQKIQAMEAYETEARVFPHPRSPESIKILAQKRGIEVGLPYAECFELVRDVR